MQFTNGTVVVFPDGFASWVDDALVFEGESFRDGDEVTLGGGPGSGGPAMDAFVPDGCDAESYWMVSPPA